MGKCICVYCASSNTIDKAFFDEARALGEAFARGGHTLIYGGGSIGLMGEIACSSLDHGGHVVGVIPQVLAERELALHRASELIITRDMHERKAVMAQRADAFIALPGGFGTLEEVLEIITHRQLDFHDKPCVIVNFNGFYDPLIEQFERIFSMNFAMAASRKTYVIAADGIEALEYIERYG